MSRHVFQPDRTGDFERMSEGLRKAGPGINYRRRERRRPRVSAAAERAYWTERQADEADAVEPEEFDAAALEFPPGAAHDPLTCRLPGHRSCAAKRAWVTMRAKRAG